MRDPMDRSRRLTDGTRWRTFMRLLRLDDLMTSYTNASPGVGLLMVDLDLGTPRVTVPHLADVARLASSTCAWRINRIKRLSEFGTSLGSASATGTNRDQLVIQLLPQTVPAGAPPAPHAFDGRYSNVEKRLASPPDRLWSRTRCGRDTRGESCRSVALRRGAKAARKEQS